MKVKYWVLWASGLLSPVFAGKPEMFPPDVANAGSYYSEWYGPALADMGERSLSELAANDGAAHIRLSFFPGASLIKGPVAATIHFRIPTQGRASVTVRELLTDHGVLSKKMLRRRSLSPEDVKSLEDLARNAGLWGSRSETWTSEGDGNEIYVHCTELIMERAQGQAYSVSHVLVSCVQPSKLMPFIDRAVELARMKPAMLHYSR